MPSPIVFHARINGIFVPRAGEDPGVGDDAEWRLNVDFGATAITDVFRGRDVGVNFPSSRGVPDRTERFSLADDSVHNGDSFVGGDGPLAETGITFGDFISLSPYGGDTSPANPIFRASGREVDPFAPDDPLPDVSVVAAFPTADHDVIFGGTRGPFTYWINASVSLIPDATQFGDRNANTLSGTDGSDLLIDAGGDDVLIGRAGDDLIYGGAGNNLHFGGTGNDTFGFDYALRFAVDTIADFGDAGVGGDVIDLSSSGFCVRNFGFDQIQRFTRQEGADTMIELAAARQEAVSPGFGHGYVGAHVLRLVNFDAASLNADDFIFR